MLELSATAYLWIKAVHVMSFISWMAGLLYLPRLYVYHAAAEPGTEPSATFKVMERRLYRAIMNPAMVATVATGGLMLADGWSALMAEGWMHAKLTLVAGMLAVHWFLGRWRHDFAADANTRPQRFYRIANEVPTVLMIAIAILVIVRPF